MSHDIPKAPNPYASGGHTKTLDEQTKGRTYRVINGPGEPPKIWGQGLAWAAAHKLKEQVAGGRKSKNVLIEDMQTVPTSHAPSDPILRAQYEAGMAAAQGAAAEAQARADAIAANARAKALADQIVPVEIPEDPDLADSEISDMLAEEGAMPSDEEIASAADPSGTS